MTRHLEPERGVMTRDAIPRRRPVVRISHRSGDRCGGCGAEIMKGMFVQITRATGLRCLACTGLGDLVFLPAGDPVLTRRAMAFSVRAATVVKFSRARKRHERQGVLVEGAALERAKEACQKDAARREAARTRQRARQAAAEQAYSARFAERIRELFPACPPGEAEAIARHACQTSSGRVGRSRAAKAFDERAIMLAVRASLRHRHTRYEELLAQGFEPSEARALVTEDIETVLDRWRAHPSDMSLRRSRPQSTRPGE